MSLRKTACRSCVVAKRRCDVGIPACSRCRQRSLVCSYPYPQRSGVHQDTTSETASESNRTIKEAISVLPDQQTNGTFWGESPANSNQTDTVFFPIDSLLPDLTTIPESNWESFEEDALDWLTPYPPAENTGLEISGLERRVLDFWPRIDDHETWHFCQREFLTYVDVFVCTGTTTPVITPLLHQGAGILLSQPLQDAYGVCAAYHARVHAQQPFYRQLLHQGIKTLIRDDAVHRTLREQLEFVQALVLYYILFFWAGGNRDAWLGGQLESSLGRGTAALENAELAARRAISLPPEKRVCYKALCGSARRLVLLSYMVRAVRSVVEHRRCDFIRYLAGLPVSGQCGEEDEEEVLSSPGEGRALLSVDEVISYDQFVCRWECGGMGDVDGFERLLLIACKGVGYVDGRVLSASSPALVF